MRVKSPSQLPHPADGSESGASACGGGGRSQGLAYETSHARIAKVICSLGGSDLDLAAALGVEEDTVREWIRAHAEFREACRFGIEAADASVERSLLQRALGYWRTDVKVFRYKGRTIYAPYRVHVVPDVKAAIFWLISRRPDKWSPKGGKAKSAAPETDLSTMLRQMREMRTPDGGASQTPPS